MRLPFPFLASFLLSHVPSTDGSGQIDIEEACTLFAEYMAPGSSAADVKRTATNLVSTLDSDRSGKLSFEEFAFRFGRKLQMELAKKRRAGLTSPDAHASAAGRAPAPAHEDLVEVNHGALLDDFSQYPSGAYMRRAASKTCSAPPTAQQNFGGQGVSSSNYPSSQIEEPAPISAGSSVSWGREALTVIGIALSLLALLAFAVLTPAPDAAGSASARIRSQSQGRTNGR